MATMGGFCAGKTFVIDHQRLSGMNIFYTCDTCDHELVHFTVIHDSDLHVYM